MAYHRPVLWEPLERRTLLAVATLGDALGQFQFTDGDGDQVTVRLRGPGTAELTLVGDAADHAELSDVVLNDTTERTTLTVRVKQGGGGDGLTTLGTVLGDGSLRALQLKEVTLVGQGVSLGGALGALQVDAIAGGASVSLGEAGRGLRMVVGQVLGDDGGTVDVTTPGSVKLLRVHQDAVGLRAAVGGAIGRLTVGGDLSADSIIAATGDIRDVAVAGAMHDASVLAGATLDASFDLADADYQSAVVRRVRVGGDVIDSIIAAGGDPGEDHLFADGDVLPGGLIRSLAVGGRVIGMTSPHVNPGIYAAELGRVNVNGLNLTDKPVPQGSATVGSAVIDPLPSAENALAVDDIETILERAVARADQLGVAATISLTDREGNLLAVVRMDGAAETVDIEAGGVGGLEAVDGIVSTSLISATKAGTAAFLSTSQGNAFTTRTAGYIIQRHFPPGIDLQDAGPLFGVQLSSLPTSEVNQLPLGLSADPGGLPLYRGGELIGGVGVEVDGVYTVDPTRTGGAATDEEQIALAGQIGFTPPRHIRADRVFIDGIRLDYANASPPRLASLGSVPDFDDLVTDGDIDVLVAPRVSPDSKFAITSLGGFVGEVPNNDLQDFYDDVAEAFVFLDGDEAAPGVSLTAADVETVLEQAHVLNDRLRAQIRRDSPQRSQVTVSVVDQNGNLLGAFRTLDAPVFGYDVSAQKARTAAYFSRPDAGDELRALDGDGAGGEVDVDAINDLLPGVFGGATDPYSDHVERAADIGVALDGSVAVADRTGGFLARPNLPDGIGGARPGPLSVQDTTAFSPFNTGLQTDLVIPQLVEFLLTFNDAATTLGEAEALDMFISGAIGGGGVVPLDSNAGDGGDFDLNPGGGLPASSMANGMQIFAGSVPLYKDGVLVGGVGVSGDGIEQDDYIAFRGADGFQEFGAGVTRADHVVILGNIRLPYIKQPRSPFAGL